MKHKIIFMMLLSLQICIPSAFSETLPADLQKKMEKTIRKGQKVQADADAWAKEREVFLNEIRELKKRSLF